MKHQLFSLFILFSSSLIGQEETPKPVNNDFKHFQIGVNYSPEIAYRKLINLDGSFTSLSTIAFKNQSSLIKFGFTTGVSGRYNFTKHFAIETGIHYSNKGYSSQKIFALQSQNDSTATIIGKSRQTSSFRYIDIPLKASITFCERNRIRFTASAGLVTNIFLTSLTKDVLDYTEGGKRISKTFDQKNYSKATLSATAGIGIDYTLNKSMNLRVEPGFRYGITRINNQPPVSARLWDIGINIGYYISF
jgi:Outer membrane protein beta-barrel domain